MTDIAKRLDALDWSAIERSIWEYGYAKTPPVLTPGECADLAAVYADESRFRSRIDMARYRFGVGEYKYFAAPLPPLVEALRVNAYPPLAAIANQWQAAFGDPDLFPTDLPALLRRCHKRGQTKPTPLLLRYEAGGYNCLHQDLYGEVAFPLQVTIMLSAPDEDFTGGENVLVEQRPRAQSRPVVARLGRGQALLFPTRDRPVAGKRGPKRVAMRHGVSTVHSGERTTLGIIFHNAE